MHRRLRKVEIDMPVVATRVKELLDQHFICYETIPHVTDYTALESAEHTHTSGHQYAKAVVLYAEDTMIMAVVPAHHHVSLAVARSYLGVGFVKLAKEWRIRGHFPDCDLGAIPPFGNLYEMRTLMLPELSENPTITFNAGSHEMAISCSSSDYETLVNPEYVANLSEAWTGGES
ncbi:MAG: YbaK/EbsC family protein [Planctomycetota bacterium]